jgi:hypothetical protein
VLCVGLGFAVLTLILLNDLLRTLFSPVERREV